MALEERREEGREDRQQEEVSIETGVGKFKARGTDILTTIFGVATLMGMTLIIYAGYTHIADAKSETQSIVKVLDKLVDKQTEQVNAQRETNCLARLDPKNRREADIEFCRNLGRGR